MTYEEYEVLGKGIIENPDTAPVAIGGLLGEIKKDLESRDSLTAALSDSEKRIRDLQDTNTKLFLAQTGHSEEKDSDNETWEDKQGEDALIAYLESKAKKEDK